MRPVRVRSPLAMQIVNLDRMKFNEAVADGFYPCAPPTLRGATRIFDMDDLMALFVFARLLELNVLPRRAGQLACEFKNAIGASGNEKSDRIVYVRGIHDGFFIGSERYNPDHEKQEKDNCYPAIGRVVLTIDFYLSHIRALIAERVEDERSVLGSEDDE